MSVERWAVLKHADALIRWPMESQGTRSSHRADAPLIAAERSGR